MWSKPSIKTTNHSLSLSLSLFQFYSQHVISHALLSLERSAISPRTIKNSPSSCKKKATGNSTRTRTSEGCRPHTAIRTARTETRQQNSSNCFASTGTWRQLPPRTRNQRLNSKSMRTHMEQGYKA